MTAAGAPGGRAQVPAPRLGGPLPRTPASGMAASLSPTAGSPPRPEALHHLRGRSRLAKRGVTLR